jgi:hypothetical protein
VFILRNPAAATGWATHSPARRRQEKDRKVLETVGFLGKMTAVAAETAIPAAWMTWIESSSP